MLADSFNYVLESGQTTRWKLTEERLAEAIRLKEKQYSTGLERIKEYEKKTGLKRDHSQFVALVYSGLQFKGREAHLGLLR